MTHTRPLLIHIFLLLAVSAYSQNVDSLITAFDHQRGKVAVGTAERFFDFLADEDFSDGRIMIHPGSGADSVRALTWYWAAEWYYDIQDYDKSIEYAGKALASSRKAGTKEIECDCCNTLSIALFRKSDYHRALELARDALMLGRELKDDGLMACSLNTLAGICLASKQPAEGLKYVLEAIGICERQKDSLRLAIRCGMAAEIYHSLGDDEVSLKYSRRAYEINTAMGLRDKAAVRLSQMAAAQIAMERYDEAEESLLKALPELEKAGNMQSWAICCNQLGEICLQKEDKPGAAEYFNSALRVFAEKGDAYNMSHSHLGLSKALVPRNSDEAVAHLMQYTQIKDSLYDSGMNQGLNEYNALYRNEQISSERDRHLISKRRILAFGIAAVLLLSFFVLLLVRRNRSIKSTLVDAMDKLDVAKNRVPAHNPRKQDMVEMLKAEVRRQILEGREVDLQEAAAALCTSRANLNRQIKTQTGESSSNLVSGVRVDMAKEILASQKDRPISDVAAFCGISDVSHFISVFKKVTGVTPKQWRDGNAGKEDPQKEVFGKNMAKEA